MLNSKANELIGSNKPYSALTNIINQSINDNSSMLIQLKLIDDDKLFNSNFPAFIITRTTKAYQPRNNYCRLSSTVGTINIDTKFPWQ